MDDSGTGEIDHLSVEDVLTLHSYIVENDDHTEPGISETGSVSYTVSFVEAGHFGKKPETIHEKAFHLMRLIVANHPFVDGNKRTALLSTVAFYALNGYEFDYDRDVKRLLKEFATDEQSVDPTETIAAFAARAEPFEEIASTHDESIYTVLYRQFREQKYKPDEDRTNG